MKVSKEQVRSMSEYLGHCMTSAAMSAPADADRFKREDIVGDAALKAWQDIFDHYEQLRAQSPEAVDADELERCTVAAFDAWKVFQGWSLPLRFYAADSAAFRKQWESVALAVMAQLRTK